MNPIQAFEERFLLLNHVPIGVFAIREDYEVIFWNHRLEEWTKIPASQIVGTNILTYFPHLNQPKYRVRLKQIFEGGLPTIFSSQLHQYLIPSSLPDGRLRIQHTTVTAIPASGQTGFYALFSIEDVTDLTQRLENYQKMRDRALEEVKVRQQTEIALREREEILQQQARELVQANRIKDEFLAVVSHELRTPLNSILGWTQLLRNQKLNAATVTKALETIERNTKAQVKLIDDILDTSRIVRGKIRLNKHLIDLVPLINAVVDDILPAAEAKGIQMIEKLQVPSVQLLGDSDRLQQIFWNLLSNAIKFTPSKGQIEIQLSLVDNPESSSLPMTYERSPITQYVQIQVSDTGIGIPADFLPHIFDRFWQLDTTTTRKHGGLGLGLEIVQHLVELHGGIVKAVSQGEGQGTSFTVQLPIEPSPNCLKNSTLRSDRQEAENGMLLDECRILLGSRVLIVDDDADTRELVSFILEYAGANVVTVTSADEALDLIDSFQPDVLVSDIGMPAEDGYMLIRQIRAKEAGKEQHLPAVALTAYAKQEDRRRALSVGYQSHVAKPVEPDELVSVVAVLLGRTGETPQCSC